MLFRKLQSQGREVIQVVGHPERSWGPSLEGTGIQPVDSYRVGLQHPHAPPPHLRLSPA